MSREENNPIFKLKNDIEKRVEEECEILKKAANPKKEIREYVRNIRWNSPELANYVRKKMSDVFDNDD